MIIHNYCSFGGRHGESAALKNLLAFAGVHHPSTGQPISEALCFGIAGGIGAGYSFCPSVVRYGGGSGVSVVGRYKSYATDATWYEGFFERIGARTRVTETTGKGKAYQNLVDELRAGRPAVIWCLRSHLPFLGSPRSSCNLWMHSFVVYGVDEAAGMAYGADRAPTRVSLTLDQLAAARAGICSHRNRTLTFEPPASLAPDALAAAVKDGIRVCAQELLQPRIKTYSLPGLELWAKMIVNETNKDGWLKAFQGGLMAGALRDVFDSIETAGTGGGLYRGLYADFLDEAAALLQNNTLGELAALYRDLGRQWTALAEAALPDSVPPLRQAGGLLREQRRLFEEIDEPAMGEITAVTDRLRALDRNTRESFALGPAETRTLLEELRERIVHLHRAESDAARRLGSG